MTPKHNNAVENIAEFNLLHDIINPPKRAKTFNSHYSPSLHGCMNTKKVKTNFKIFFILLDGSCSSTILMGRLIEKLCPEKDTPMQ